MGAVTWHPFDRNRVSFDIWQAQDIKNYKFYGKAAHASKHPELGRSALDAAELMNVGVNYLREHVADDVRMHYTYTNTDSPANIVPPYAATNYFIRSGKWERTEDASKRVGRLRQRSGPHDGNPGRDPTCDMQQRNESEPHAGGNLLRRNAEDPSAGLYRRGAQLRGRDSKESGTGNRRPI